MFIYIYIYIYIHFYIGEVSVRCAILIATDGLYDMMSNEHPIYTLITLLLPLITPLLHPYYPLVKSLFYMYCPYSCVYLHTCCIGEVSVRCAILIATDGLYDMMSNEHPIYTLITLLLHPYYTLVTPYYTLIIPLLHPYYTLITPLLNPYFTCIAHIHVY
jgi:hypothetical protein